MFNNLRCKDFDIVISKHKSKNKYLFSLSSNTFLFATKVKDFQPSKNNFDQVIFSVLIRQVNAETKPTNQRQLQFTGNTKQIKQILFKLENFYPPKILEFLSTVSIKLPYFAIFIVISPVQGWHVWKQYLAPLHKIRRPDLKNQIFYRRTLSCFNGKGFLTFILQSKFTDFCQKHYFH